MADIDPLDEDSYDPLEEEGLEPDTSAMRYGTGSEDVEGFGFEVIGTMERIAHLSSIKPGTKYTSATGKQVKRRKRIFLKALAATGIISHAASRAGWSVAAANYHKSTDPQFKEMWEEAQDISADLFELEAIRRAVHGVDKPVWDRGGKEREPGILGYETQYSDGLLTLILKARRPEKFRDRHEVDHKGNGGGGVLVVPGMVPLEEWSIAAAKQQAQYREKKED